MSHPNTNAVQAAYAVEAVTPFCSHWLKVRMIVETANVTETEAQEALRYVWHSIYAEQEVSH